LKARAILGKFEDTVFGGQSRAEKLPTYNSLEARVMILGEFENTEIGGPSRALIWPIYVYLEARAIIP
jgi:hypothetical protein